MRAYPLCVLMGMIAYSSAFSADYTWQGGDGLFSDTAMWSPTGVPGLGDSARLNASAPGTLIRVQ